MYKVLWIDDDCKEDDMGYFIEEAEEKGFILDGYESYEEAFDILEKNIDKYDIILLDGLFHEKKGQEKGTEGITAIGKSINRISELKSRKVFPWFVFSGQEKFTNDDYYILEQNGIRCYDKKYPPHREELFRDMKAAADDLPNVQIRHNYKRVFQVCTGEYVSELVGQSLLNLLKIEDAHVSANHFTAIRINVEHIFVAFNKFKLLPDEFVKYKVKLNPSSVFLSGYQNDKVSDLNKMYIHNEETHLPRQIANCLKFILEVVQPGAHISHVRDHVQKVQTPYLFKSTLYQLMDLLVWFKIYIDSNPKTNNWEKREATCQTSEDATHDYNENNWILGEVARIGVDGWGTFRPLNTSDAITIIPQMLLDNELELGDYIKVITEPSPDGSKLHIKAISKDV